MDATRALLDSLMGADRDAGKHGKKKSFKDDDVCKHYLVWECPHDFFLDTNGKAASTSPIGPCPKQHSDALKERFEHDKDFESCRRRYLQELRAALRRHCANLDTKVNSDRARLTQGVSCSKETAGVVGGGSAAREMLIQEKIEAAERMAAEGQVELSQRVMEDADRLAAEKKHLDRVKELADSWVDEICGICGRQTSWRAPEEMEARKHGRPHPHESGSFHTGWKRLRETLIEVEEELEKAKAKNDQGDGHARDASHSPADAARQKSARSRSRDRSRTSRAARGRMHEASRGGRAQSSRSRDRCRVDPQNGASQRRGSRDRARPPADRRPAQQPDDRARRESSRGRRRNRDDSKDRGGKAGRDWNNHLYGHESRRPRGGRQRSLPRR